jgi:hypothetical protein
VLIFALETDVGKLKQRFLSAEESEIRTVHFHGFRFFLAIINDILAALLIGGAVYGLLYAGVPMEWVISVAAIFAFFLVFLPFLRAYIDWRYDFVLVTTDKVIIVDQSSLFRQKVTPINLENVASASAETQFWNLFPFGILQLNLKEGRETPITLRYIPDVQGVVSALSDAITRFQRRKDLRRYGGVSEEEHEKILEELAHQQV